MYIRAKYAPMAPTISRRGLLPNVRCFGACCYGCGATEQIQRGGEEDSRKRQRGRSNRHDHRLFIILQQDTTSVSRLGWSDLFVYSLPLLSRGVSLVKFGNGRWRAGRIPKIQKSNHGRSLFSSMVREQQQRFRVCTLARSIIRWPPVATGRFIF